MNNKILFQEKQKFTQWWLWLIFLVPITYSLYGLISPIYESKASHSGNISISLVMPIEYWIAFISMLAVLLFMFLMTMTTKIDADKINVKHLFFAKKDFPWNEIESAEIIKYGFLGYGIRFSAKYGTIYNVKGSQGLALTLKNGKKYLIGTQKPEELQRLVKEILD